MSGNLCREALFEEAELFRRERYNQYLCLLICEQQPWITNGISMHFVEEDR